MKPFTCAYIFLIIKYEILSKPGADHEEQFDKALRNSCRVMTGQLSVTNGSYSALFSSIKHSILYLKLLSNIGPDGVL